MSGGATETAAFERRLAEASAWRLRLDEKDVQTSIEFEQWMAQSEGNRDAWARVEAPGATLQEHVNAPELITRRREALARAEKSVSDRRPRAVAWRRVAALFLLVAFVGGGIGGALWWRAQPQRYVTELGERRSVVLSDGSRVSLDSDSDVRVRFTEDARMLELRRGQARFEVAHDVTRPFSVRAADQRVIALGTVFSINLTDAKVVVTLIEGRVAVIDEDAPPRSQSREQSLVAGQQLLAVAEMAPSIAPANIARATAWERGQLDFADDRLADVAVEVGRYSRNRIVIEDPAVAALRISGVVNTGDLNGFVGLVSGYLPVDAVELENGDILLRRRSA